MARRALDEKPVRSGVSRGVFIMKVTWHPCGSGLLDCMLLAVSAVTELQASYVSQNRRTSCGAW